MAELSKISDILIGAALDERLRVNSVKKATAFGFWKNICGTRFAKFSTPADVKGTTLIVAVKSPEVMQELIFNNDAILNKLKNYFLPLTITINNIRYDYKIWNKVNSTVFLMGEDDLEQLPPEEIENVKLDAEKEIELKKVTNSISKLSFLNEKQKENYKKNIINSFKAKKIQEV